jgi:hypothetical protein
VGVPDVGLNLLIFSVKIERTLKDIKFLFFNTLYLWTTAFVSHLEISNYDFLVLFAPTS